MPLSCECSSPPGGYAFALNETAVFETTQRAPAIRLDTLDCSRAFGSL